MCRIYGKGDTAFIRLCANTGRKGQRIKVEGARRGRTGCYSGGIPVTTKQPSSMVKCRWCHVPHLRGYSCSNPECPSRKAFSMEETNS